MFEHLFDSRERLEQLACCTSAWLVEEYRRLDALELRERAALVPSATPSMSPGHVIAGGAGPRAPGELDLTA